MSKGSSPLPLLLGLGGLAALVFWRRSASAASATPVEPPKQDVTPPPPAAPLPADATPATVSNCMGSDVTTHTLFPVQRALIALKFLPRNTDGTPTANGVCNPATRKAIAAYRAARGLIVGEFVNARMLAMLKSEVPCAFLAVHWVTKPELWGVLSLAGTAGAYVIVSPKSTPFGSYDAAVVVKKEASSGTEAKGDLCPYGVITKVLKPGADVAVGDFAAKRVPSVSPAGVVTWSEEPWALVE